MPRILSPSYALIITAVVLLPMWHHQRLYARTAATKQTPQSIKEINGAALIEERSMCGRYASAKKCFWIDGYPISIKPQTSIYIGPPSTTFRYWPMSGSKINIHGKLSGKSKRISDYSEVLKPNTWVIYHATFHTS